MEVTQKNLAEATDATLAGKSAEPSAFGGSFLQSSGGPFAGINFFSAQQGGASGLGAAPGGAGMGFGAGVVGALGSGSGSGNPFASAMGGGRDYRAEVTAIYQEHNPDKLGSLEALFQKYSGQEQKLYLMVCKKYNVTPAASAGGPG